MLRHLASILLALTVLSACAQNPAGGMPMFTLVGSDELRAVGDDSANAVLRAEGLYRPDSTATAYVTTLCNRIYSATEAAAEPVQCNLIDDGSFNAFATPGYLFVQRGLLPFLSSETELAGVLGHEAGHLTARHTARSITTGKIGTTMVFGAMAAVGYAGGASSYPVMDAAATLGRETNQVANQTFGRAHEHEADDLARRYLGKAGYNPADAVSMARALQQYDIYLSKQAIAFGAKNETLLDRLKASHPATPDRLAAALKATGEPPVLAPEADLGRQRYMAAIDGLTYGPARRYGIARKNELVLTRQRLVIPFPQGTTSAYMSSNHPRNLGVWVFAHPQSGVSVQLTSLPVISGRNPATMVEDMLPMLHTPVTRIAIGTSQPIQLAARAEDADTAATDGDDPTETADAKADAALDEAATSITPQVMGYTSVYRHLNSPKRVRVVAFGAPTRSHEMIVYTATYPTEQVMQQEDANLMAILKNIRFLTRDQSLKYQQLQLHTFRAAVGQTVAQQASHLPVSALNEDLFRALNNLPEGTDMQPGQLYKTILDPNP